MTKNQKGIIKNEDTSLPARESVYQIGRTTYKVNMHFTPDSPDTLADVLKRLILKNIGNDNSAA